MKKPFIVANVREITDKWLREEISFSKMVELFNEIAEKHQALQLLQPDVKRSCQICGHITCLCHKPMGNFS